MCCYAQDNIFDFASICVDENIVYLQFTKNVSENNDGYIRIVCDGIEISDYSEVIIGDTVALTFDEAVADSTNTYDAVIFSEFTDTDGDVLGKNITVSFSFNDICVSLPNFICENNITEEDTVTASVIMTNSLPISSTAAVFLCTYNKDGTLSECFIGSKLLSPGNTSTVSVSFRTELLSDMKIYTCSSVKDKNLLTPEYAKEYLDSNQCAEIMPEKKVYLSTYTAKLYFNNVTLSVTNNSVSNKKICLSNSSDSISVECCEFSQSGIITGPVTYVNTSDETTAYVKMYGDVGESCCFLLASYTPDGMLYDAKVLKYTADGTAASVSQTVSSGDGFCVKSFFWNDMINIAPLIVS